MAADRSRRVEVGADRFAGWVRRFGERHGGSVRLDREAAGDGPVLLAADGATASLDLLVPAPDVDLDQLVEHVERPHRYLLVLVRRGGWAVGVAEGSRVLESRVGTRYVQGRTKAGGWSQQRYARRRAGQAATVVEAAADAAVSQLRDHRVPLCVPGGDRLLLRDTLRLLQQRGPAVEVSGRRLDVPDPRRRVLDDAARSACAVRILVAEPAC